MGHGTRSGTPRIPHMLENCTPTRGACGEPVDQPWIPKGGPVGVRWKMRVSRSRVKRDILPTETMEVFVWAPRAPTGVTPVRGPCMIDVFNGCLLDGVCPVALPSFNWFPVVRLSNHV
eukprot:gene11500-biopygen21407